MLFTIGSRAHGGDVVDLLVACHHRIREHLVLARRIATAPPGSPEANVRAAAARVHAYFDAAFPLHRDDEEADIFPVLAGRSDELDVAIGALSHEHDTHDAQVARLVDICRELEREPAAVAVVAEELGGLVDLLERELIEHLDLEERTVFPAIALLAPHERDLILERMRTRRGRQP